MPIQDASNYNKQHAVPQNIMDVEFKIIGELTLRQFAYLIIFGGIAYVTAVYMGGIFKWPLVVICALLGVGLAFVPLEERGLDQWIVNFFHAVYSPNQKIWKKDLVAPAVFLYQNMAVVKQELITLAPTSSRRKLEEFLEQTDSTKAPDRLDIPEEYYIKMARDAYPIQVTTAPSAPVMVEETYEEPVQEQIPEQTPEQTPEPEQKKEPPKEIVEIVSEVKSEVKPEVKVEVPLVVTPQPVAPVKPKIKPQVVIKAPVFRKSNAPVLTPMTPDRHSGRRFVNLLPKQGEIILPIRGEKVIQTSAEVDIEKDIAEKTSQLNMLIEQIKGSEEYKKAQTRSAVTVAPVSPAQPASVPFQTTSPSPMMPPVQSQPSLHQVPAVPEPELVIDNLAGSFKKENERLVTELKTLKHQLDDLKVKKEAITPIYVGTQEHVNSVAPSYAKVAPLTSKPNVLTGIVKDSLGGGIEGIVVITKNDRGEAVRASKTNTLGQFSLITPLINGKYTVEVDQVHKTDLTFDIISLNVKGEVIPPLEFSGK